MSPSVSVVIPCFNASRFIEATIRSVLAQTGFDLDVVVVDDGSSDNSAELVEQEFPSVRVLRQSNAGVSAARNLGIHAALSEWVAFVDADDVWLPGKLAAQWDALSRQPEASMACGAWKVWESDASAPDPAWLADLLGQADEPALWSGPSGDIYPELLTDCHVWTSTVVVRRSLLLDLGGFDPALRVGEDYDLWLRASRRTAVVWVPRPLALYRHHQSNTTRRVPIANHKAEVVERALVRWGYVSAQGRSASRRLVRRGLGRSWSDYAGALLLAGRFDQARTASCRAVRMNPMQWLGWAVLAKALLQRRVRART